VETLVSAEFSCFFLNEFEDRVDLFGWPVEVLGRERVEGEGLDPVFKTPVQYFFSYFGADDMPVVGSESVFLRPSPVAV